MNKLKPDAESVSDCRDWFDRAWDELSDPIWDGIIRFYFEFLQRTNRSGVDELVPTLTILNTAIDKEFEITFFRRNRELEASNSVVIFTSDVTLSDLNRWCRWLVDPSAPFPKGSQ